MALIDFLVLIVFAAAIVGGFTQGFLRSVFSLGGLFFGLAFASWNYASAARLLLPILRFEPLANAFGFLLIVLLVTAIANLIGKFLSRTAHGIGLGCLDRILGAFLGFFQGWLVMTVLILAVVAFFPHAQWLSRGRLTHFFVPCCHVGANIGPNDLGDRIRDGLDLLNPRQHTSD